MKLDAARIRQIAFFVAGFAVCTISVLFLIWGGAARVPGLVSQLVLSLPWIGVALVVVWWRAGGGQRVHPLAYLLGTATALILNRLLLMM